MNGLNNVFMVRPHKTMSENGRHSIVHTKRKSVGLESKSYLMLVALLPKGATVPAAPRMEGAVALREVTATEERADDVFKTSAGADSLRIDDWANLKWSIPDSRLAVEVWLKKSTPGVEERYRWWWVPAPAWEVTAAVWESLSSSMSALGVRDLPWWIASPLGPSGPPLGPSPPTAAGEE